MMSFTKRRPASVYALPVKSVTTFDDYARVAFAPLNTGTPSNTSRTDIVSDGYPLGLKEATR